MKTMICNDQEVPFNQNLCYALLRDTIPFLNTYLIVLIDSDMDTSSLTRSEQ